MAQLLRDDADVHAFGAELGGVRVPEAVGVDSLLDAGLARHFLQLGVLPSHPDRNRSVNHNAPVKQRLREFHRRIPGARSEP